MEPTPFPLSHSFLDRFRHGTRDITPEELRGRSLVEGHLNVTWSYIFPSRRPALRALFGASGSRGSRSPLRRPAHPPTGADHRRRPQRKAAKRRNQQKLCARRAAAPNTTPEQIERRRTKISPAQPPPLPRGDPIPLPHRKGIDKPPRDAPSPLPQHRQATGNATDAAARRRRQEDCTEAADG